MSPDKNPPVAPSATPQTTVADALEVARQALRPDLPLTSPVQSMAYDIVSRLAPEAKAQAEALDDAVGMLVDLIEVFPLGEAGHHLALHFRGRLGEVLPYVSAARQSEWDAS